MRAFLAIVAAFVLGVALAVAAEPAHAQAATWSMSEEYSGKTPSAAYQQPTHAPTPHSAIQHHASTAIEGYLRGKAAVMKAYAEGQMSLAQARILNEEAYARNRQNRVINSQTFVERRNLLKEDQRDRRRKQWDWMEEAKQHKAKREQSVLLTAYQLPDDQLDRVTGEIAWPATLGHPVFAECRERVETAFARLAIKGVDASGRYADTAAMAAESMRDLVREYRDGFGDDLDAFFGSQRFLAGLKYEAQFWDATTNHYTALASR